MYWAEKRENITLYDGECSGHMFWSKNDSLGENSFEFYIYMCTNIWWDVIERMLNEKITINE